MIETSEIENRAAQQDRLPAPLAPLERLAWNYWWSWAADGAEIFSDFDPAIWEDCEYNPRQLLAKTSAYRLAEAATDPVYLERVRRIDERFQTYMASGISWPIDHANITVEHPVAYFCAEFGVHNSLPLYSGGLGILAGDHLKSASDLNLPLVAVGLFYHYGYFRQRLNREGWQEESYRATAASQLPLRSVEDESAQPLLVEVFMRGRQVRARAWRADVGRVRLYLLDTNVAENEEIDRLVTGHLYGGDRETRLVPEEVLGIGGARLLGRLGLRPGVYHLNEGHSAFLTLEIARQLIETEGLEFATAAEKIRERCVFTTHTPVAAGHDEFSPELLDRAFGNWYETALGISREEFLALGRVNGSSEEAFGLTPLALRMCH